MISGTKTQDLTLKKGTEIAKLKKKIICIWICTLSAISIEMCQCRTRKRRGIILFLVAFGGVRATSGFVCFFTDAWIYQIVDLFL